MNFVSRGHVRLILLSNNDSSFYLRIPLEIIGSLCLKPRKYLVFLGWCILGVEGHLALEDRGQAITTNGPLEDRGTYYYVADVEGKFKSLPSCLRDTDDALSVSQQLILRS